MNTLTSSPARAADIAAQFELSDEARNYLAPQAGPLIFLEQLSAASLWVDAMRLIAHTLSKSDAVRWACRCVAAHATTVPLPPLQQAALKATQTWLETSNENDRRAAFAAANAAGLDNGAGCAALAAFWSGGSMAPEDAPVVPPSNNLCHHAASCAVILTGTVQPQSASDHYQQFIAFGKEFIASTRS